MTQLGAVQIAGDGTHPVPQGSYVCKSRHLPGLHSNVQPDNETKLKKWRKLVAKAGAAIRPADRGPLVGDLFIFATHTIARPATVPLRERAWPLKKSPGHGDVDKLSRALLDGLADGGVYLNDAQVCGIHITKRYPDSPPSPFVDPRDHLDRPGVVIRIYPMGG